MVQPAIILDPAPDATRDAVIFFVYAGVAILLAIAGAYAARRHSELAGFILVPCLCAAIMYENVAIAITSIVPLSSSVLVQGVFRLRCAVQCFIVPLFVTTLFELNYEVHKRRSANFCGCISFDRGHRRAGVVGQLVRYSSWFIALALLLLDIVVSAPYMTNPLLYRDTLRYANKSLGIYRTAGGVDWTDTLDFVPTALLLLFSFYTGASFWRYGTTMSTDVRTTALNPWISITAASAGITLAWVLTPASWPLPYAVNGTLLTLLGAIIITLSLVDLNLTMLETWARTLENANEAVLLAMARNQKEREMLELIKAKRRLAPEQAANVARRRMLARNHDPESATSGWAGSRGDGGVADAAGQPRELEMVALRPTTRSTHEADGVPGAADRTRPATGRRRRQRSYSSDAIVRRNMTGTDADLNRMLDEVLHGDIMEEGEEEEEGDDEQGEEADGGDADQPNSDAVTAIPLHGMAYGAGSGSSPAPVSAPRTLSMPVLPRGAPPPRPLIQPSVAAVLASGDSSGAAQMEGGSFGRLAALVGARSRRTTPAHWRLQEESWRRDETKGPLWSRVHDENGAAPAPAAAAASIATASEDAAPGRTQQQQHHQLAAYASPAVRSVLRH